MGINLLNENDIFECPTCKSKLFNIKEDAVYVKNYLTGKFEKEIYKEFIICKQCGQDVTKNIKQ